MPDGTCDPASRGMGYNQGVMNQGPNGNMVVTYRYGWDGTSVKPNCVGPLIYVSAVNGEGDTYYAHFQGRKGTWRTIACEPGQIIVEERPNVLRQMGLSTNEDVEGLYITRDPNPPMVTFVGK